MELEKIDTVFPGDKLSECWFKFNRNMKALEKENQELRLRIERLENRFNIFLREEDSNSHY